MYRKTELMTILVIFILNGILLSFVTINCMALDNISLSNVIGDVAASLIDSLYITPVDTKKQKALKSSIVVENARNWNDYVLAEGKKTPDTAKVVFQRWQEANYDTIEFQFKIQDQIIITKQTIFVMVVSLPNQNIQEKSSEELIEIIENLANEYLAGSEQSIFIPIGEFNSTKVFQIQRDIDNQTGDYRDKIMAIIREDVINFSFIKKKSVPSAARVSDEPKFNKRWFNISTKRKKIK